MSTTTTTTTTTTATTTVSAPEAQPEFTLIKVNPLHPTFGAEVTGIDFSKPVSDDVFREVLAAITKVYPILPYHRYHHYHHYHHYTAYLSSINGYHYHHQNSC